MSGNLLQRARRDSLKYLTKGGFEETIFLKTKNGLNEALTTGFSSKHHINFDADGNSINSKNAHICISETELVSLGYPVRNANNEVDLYLHRVSVSDSSGLTKEYVINEIFPDETLGLITCILGDFKL